MSEPDAGPISAIALVRDDGRALLQLRDPDPAITHPDMWVFPGGHAGPDEDALACARRELAEETAYDADDLVHLGEIRDPEEVARGPVSLFLARYDGRQEVECREGADMRWVSRTEAGALDVPRFLLDAWDDLVVPYIFPAADRLEAKS